MSKVRFKFKNKKLKKYFKKYLTNKGIRNKIKEKVVFTDREKINLRNYKIIHFTDKISYKKYKYTVLLPDKRQNIIKNIMKYLNLQ
ncbi:MAG: hypothetical protein FXF47_06000 [Candidatus Mcinerneyibacterium aminivorans]|jgi:hypothetical protein|uniref:Uncharacterized protein n=1 Tax=Candidatus Mcinerneyibacterium aminivorans TaxID=2703815 RepID=A0A5D0MDN1_9BACT|nr:MAG: hypothetical protein FXF47_06000 [Candidatus Mcinerneyibacterium aminivorans]